MPKISNVQMVYQLQQPVLLIKSIVTLDQLPEMIGSSFSQLAGYLDELGELITNIPFVIYHDFADMDDQRIEVEICFPVIDALPDKGDIKFRIIPASKTIFCMYLGSYAEITPVYQEMEEWLENQGYKVKGPCYEYYYNGDEFPESELLTKVVIPFE